MNKRLGIIGGGQLGMFICIAAKKLNIQTSLFSSTDKFSARDFCDNCFVGSFEDNRLLDSFIDSADYFTIETENIPKKILEKIEERKQLFPGSMAIKIAQNRVYEKNFINSIEGLKTVKFSKINNYEELLNEFKEYNYKAIIKSSELGYDGKNQYLVKKENIKSFENKNLENFIIEEFIEYDMEISVIVCKGEGNLVVYPPVENIHQDSILKESKYPGKIPNNIRKKSIEHAKKIAEKISLRGILAVEMFVIDSNEIIINELAPRPHNSGHLTMDCCEYNQFDNLIYSIFSKKVKEPKPFRNCRMVNIIGEDYNNIENLKSKYICYDYNKEEIRPKRKMGHYVII